MTKYRYVGLDVVHVPELGLEFLEPGTEFETDAPISPDPHPLFERVDPSKSKQKE